jgi:hypothetical protein
VLTCQRHAIYNTQNIQNNLDSNQENEELTRHHMLFLLIATINLRRDEEIVK